MLGGWSRNLKLSNPIMSKACSPMPLYLEEVSISDVMPEAGNKKKFSNAGNPLSKWENEKT